MSNLKKIKEESFIKLNEKLNLLELIKLKSDLFGKNGLISSQFKRIGSIALRMKEKICFRSECY
jgi:phenylalanyl-tRNA synthetase alpha chain